MSPFSSSGWRIFPAEGFVSVYFSPVSGGFGTLGWSAAYRFFQWVEDLGRWKKTRRYWRKPRIRSFFCPKDTALMRMGNLWNMFDHFLIRAISPCMSLLEKGVCVEFAGERTGYGGHGWACVGRCVGNAYAKHVGRADSPVLRWSDHEAYECRAAAADRAEYESRCCHR